MPKLCPHEYSPTNLLAAVLRLFDTNSNYQKQISLSVYEAKEAREATETVNTEDKLYQKQREISMKMLLYNLWGYFSSFARKYL